MATEKNYLNCLMNMVLSIIQPLSVLGFNLFTQLFPWLIALDKSYLPLSFSKISRYPKVNNKIKIRD